MKSAILFTLLMLLQMNTSSIHSSGALLLEPINRIYPDGKPLLSGQRPPIPPLQLDTPLATTATVANGNVFYHEMMEFMFPMPTDVMEMDDGPDMDMGDGYYSDHNDNTTPKSHLATRRVSHMISSDGCHGIC